MKAWLIIILLIQDSDGVTVTTVSEQLPTMAACNTALTIVEQDLKANTPAKVGAHPQITPLVTRCVRIE